MFNGESPSWTPSEIRVLLAFGRNGGVPEGIFRRPFQSALATDAQLEPRENPLRGSVQNFELSLIKVKAAGIAQGSETRLSATGQC